jgi:ribose transport system ATP-binding protein
MAGVSALLEARALRKSFAGTAALREVDLTAEAGEVHAVLGENGAGKSTLMKILAGALEPDGGSLRFGGARFAPESPAAAAAAGVAIVYQEPALCPHLSVAENICLGREPTRRGLFDRRAAEAAAAEALARLAGEGHTIAPAALAGALSPGDRQLCAIARALGQRAARLLILDEPTSSLAAADAERLFAAVAKLRQDGLAILYISHFLEEVERVADRYTVLRDGASVHSGAMADTTLAALVRHMVGEDVAVDVERAPRAAAEAGEPVLVLDGLAGVSKPTRASLSLARGEVLGVAGLVGSGRTELLRAIFGLDRVRSGSLRVGAFVGPASPAARLAQGVGLLSEDRKGEGLAAGMTVADNLTLSKLDGLGPAGLVLPSRQDAVARRFIERLSIKTSGPRQRVGDLSGGNQQKVALARLLHHEVDVFLLDEPTRGIDIKSRAEIYRLIEQAAARGAAVLMVSSYLPELLGACDRIAVMRRGQLGPAHRRADVDAHALLAEASFEAKASA